MPISRRSSRVWRTACCRPRRRAPSWICAGESTAFRTPRRWPPQRGSASDRAESPVVSVSRETTRDSKRIETEGRGYFFVPAFRLAFLPAFLAALRAAFFGLAAAFRAPLDFLDPEDLRARAPPEARPPDSPPPPVSFSTSAPPR